ncbi:hypothetical protein BDQ12DRAFT_688906 [Crucibulum laeve]|uniref:Secreted protein n=1 Tax=Crucibulum laeve TaxID=68775 RepID=A0A5C3LNS6_9AGAR|nr:hypothetical protein BDQ12DRAFT_688906 [Crucibulum laeve]
MPSNHIRPSTILASCLMLRISAACPVGPPPTYQAAVIRPDVNSKPAGWRMLVSHFSCECPVVVYPLVGPVA